VTGPLGPLLLSDATMPVNFCLAGLPAAKAMAEFLGERVHVVDEVHDELTRIAEEGLVPLQTLLESWPANEVIRLDPSLRAQIAPVIQLRELQDRHPKEDRGETATVLYAEQRLDHGERFDILTDDGWGRQIAADRTLRCHNTPALIVSMVGADALSYKDGQRVWQKCFTSQTKWKAYREAVAREHPGKVPAAAPKKAKKSKGRKS
jgi:hypothetical protein